MVYGLLKSLKQESSWIKCYEGGKSWLTYHNYNTQQTCNPTHRQNRQQGIT